LKRLVYAEPFDRIDEAIVREKALKKWNRSWKVALIESANPEWHDLWPEVTGATQANDTETRHE
jgi:putative endonuclease